MADALAQPVHGIENFPGADAPVAVCVQKGQGLRVKLKPIGGAAHGHPEFGIEQPQVLPLRIGGQQGLIKPGHTAKRENRAAMPCGILLFCIGRRAGRIFGHDSVRM